MLVESEDVVTWRDLTVPSPLIDDAADMIAVCLYMSDVASQDHQSHLPALNIH